MSARIPTIVLGGTGYVAGELLRLIAGHPQFELAAVMSDSQPGESVIKAFPHLASAYADTRFKSQAEVEKLLAETPQAALFSAAPHGVSAALIDSLLGVAAKAGTHPRVVDISADFRYSSAEAYEAVYKHPHGAPKRIAEFTCAVPEHLKKLETTHVAHPGCFATATLLASVPLLALGVDVADAVCHRCHRQHRSRAQADRRYASPCPAQRPLFLQRALASSRAGNRRLCPGRFRC